MKVVFDLAGVLFHWQPERMLQRELPHVARDAAAARHWAGEIFQGYGGDWGDFDRGTVSVPDLVQRIAGRTGLAAADVQRVVDAVPQELQPQAETVALLQRLHGSGRTLYFLSNMPAPYADLLEARNGFFECFRDGVFSGRVHHNKPEPAIFELAARRFGHLPRELVFMDDHEPNVHAARAAGWQAFHFSSAAQAASELQQRGLLAQSV
jgi:putative hydrolase of the HAD superfamily